MKIENKIPSAEEFLYEKYPRAINAGYSWILGMEPVLIEFAKLHVKAALKAATENVEILHKNSIEESLYHDMIVVNPDSILNSYTDKLIK